MKQAVMYGVSGLVALTAWIVPAGPFGAKDRAETLRPALHDTRRSDVAAPSVPLPRQPCAPAIDEPHDADLTIGNGVDFLVKHQAKDGSWWNSGDSFFATAIVLRAMQSTPETGSGMRLPHAAGDEVASDTASDALVLMALTDPRGRLAEAGGYRQALATACSLSIGGRARVIDASGMKYDWRVRLINDLKKQQRPDGSWGDAPASAATGDRDPHSVICTAFAILVVQEARRDLRMNTGVLAMKVESLQPTILALLDR